MPNSPPSLIGLPDLVAVLSWRCLRLPSTRNALVVMHGADRAALSPFSVALFSLRGRLRRPPPQAPERTAMRM
jgi:hypothetical protein